MNQREDTCLRFTESEATSKIRSWPSLTVFGLDRDPNIIACRIQSALKYKRQGDFSGYNAIIESLNVDMQS